MFPSDNNFGTEAVLENNSMPIADDEPFKILLLGDWSGKYLSGNSSSDFLNVRPIEIDRDNFDDVLEKFQIKLNLDFENDDESLITIDIKELDDFHPDSIYQKLPCFSHLRDIRRRLLKPDAYPKAASEVRSWFDAPIKDKNIPDISRHPSDVTDSDNLLDQILDQTADVNNSFHNLQITEESELSVLIRKLVTPFLVQTDEIEQSDLLNIVDEVTGELMRKILHHSRFQLMESAWRGLHFLVRRIETNSKLKIFLLDIDKDSLSTQLKSFDNLSDSGLYNLIAGSDSQNFDKNNWSAICANFEFSIDVNDVAFLIRLAKISAVADAPLISYLIPKSLNNHLSDEDSFDFSFDEVEAKLWDSLRSISESSYLGFAFPRFLSRLPYGEKTDPLETFFFDELKSSFAGNKFVWTNPIFGCALLLAQSFTLFGWKMKDNFHLQIDDLPFYLYEKNTDIHLQNSLEFSLNQKNCIDLIDFGFMPFLSFKDSDVVRLSRFQSISKNSSSLKGGWNNL